MMLKWLANKLQQRKVGLQDKLTRAVLDSAPAASPKSDPEHWRKLGNQSLDAGNLVDAARCYQQALTLVPDSVAALVNLAYVKTELKQFNEARPLLERAVALDASNMDAWYLLGGVLEQDKNLPGAEAALRKVVELKPNFDRVYLDLCRVLYQRGELVNAKIIVEKGLKLNPNIADFYFYLGNVLFFENDDTAAIACFEKALNLQSDYAAAHVNWGKSLERQENFESALYHFQNAVNIQPANAEFHNHLGNIRLQRGLIDLAMESYQRAMTLNIGVADTHLNMASALLAAGQFQSTVDECQVAIRLRPDVAIAYNIMGIALQEMGQTQQALTAFLHALEIDPGLVAAICNIGSVRRSEAKLDEAVAQYRSALAMDPTNIAPRSNLLFTLNFHPDMPAIEIYEAYQDFDKVVGLPLRSTWLPFVNEQSSERRLRIGYVSPDFRQHSVMRFLEPVLEQHDKTAFDLYAYAEVAKEDIATARAKFLIQNWRNTVGMSDEAMAKLIRDDKIDVLVDLAGHTSNNRLRVFARKPAPVSVSWMGYGYTTGLSAVDYYLADWQLIPSGFENLFSEQPWRLNRPFVVFRAEPTAGEVGALPAAQRGGVTFGSLSRSIRINNRVIRVWSEILRRTDRSRLVVNSRDYADPVTVSNLIQEFEKHGVNRERLFIGYNTPPWDLLREIDITLDCFPHNSGTTLFESLYMGTPVVTLAARPSVGRIGASLLSGVGHSEWIADSEDRYVEIACGLTVNLSKLADLRTDLRRELMASDLMDAAGYTSSIESAYIEMYQRWLAMSDTKAT